MVAIYIGLHFWITAYSYSRPLLLVFQCTLISAYCFKTWRRCSKYS